MTTWLHADVALVGDRWRGPVAIALDGGTVIDIRMGAGSPRPDRHVPALIPGLVDAHCHLTCDASSSPMPSAEAFANSTVDPQHEAEVVQRMTTLGRAGITAVRDLGSGPGATHLYRRYHGQPGMPEVQFAGPPLTRPGGHLAYIGHEVSSEADVARAVEAVANLGAAWAKVMVTGGRMTPGTDPLALEFPEDLLRLVVRHAHDRGLRVAAHALSVEGVRAAAKAGVNTVEHGTMIARSGPLSEVPEDIIDDFLAHDISLSPTLVDRNFRHPVPLRTRAAWIHQFWVKGVRVLAGGDTGIPDVPHGSLASVVKVLCSALPAADAIASATVLPGRLMGIEHAEIKLGAKPTLLALPGDPRLDADHLVRAECLAMRGLPLDPAISGGARPGRTAQQ